MKPRKEFTFKRAILYGLVTELVLIIVQFGYLRLYVAANQGTEFAFTSSYMNSSGFYIFQIIGFLSYATIVFSILTKFRMDTFHKVAVLVIAGGIVELTFYAVMQADYRMVYFYSVLDKFVGAVFGSIVYYYTYPLKKTT